jgi:hypothetical protein
MWAFRKVSKLMKEAADQTLSTFSRISLAVVSIFLDLHIQENSINHLLKILSDGHEQARRGPTMISEFEVNLSDM